MTAELASQGCRHLSRGDNIQPRDPAPETSPQPAEARPYFHVCSPVLTEFSPIPTSNQCRRFPPPEPPPGSAPGATGACPSWRQLLPRPGSSCPALDFAENLSCSPGLARPKAQGCSALASMQRHCPDASARGSTASSEQGQAQIYGVQGPQGISSEHRWLHPSLS